MALTLTSDERTELQRRVRGLKIRAEDARERDREVVLHPRPSRGVASAGSLFEGGAISGDRLVKPLRDGNPKLKRLGADLSLDKVMPQGRTAREV